ncbi:MAG: biotin--[acetyl-CoA-carboxylase] ligase [Planctomycetota bacterium]|nr:biotin--[acetyl-CoA-carboxylase] ligase [Planctomycetota bacterium]MDA1137191.1 biotin--[acetyl-CoA-carboxylase] ligase [Planctomycetota bacterium]
MAEYLNKPDRLHPDELLNRLGTKIIGREIHVFRETASTNDIAWQFASETREGVTIFAEAQTLGRGRRGRTWIDSDGKCILMSTVVMPGLPAREFNVLTVLGAVAVCQTLQVSCGLQSTIKWPNDVLVGGKKICGILVETRQDDNKTPGTFVIGIGLNVNLTAEQLPEILRDHATSISMELGKAVHRTEVARELMRNLDAHYRDVRTGDLTALEQKWKKLCLTGSGFLTLEQSGKIYRGRVHDLDLRDGLILQLDSGVLKSFRGEHVSVVPDIEI